MTAWGNRGWEPEPPPEPAVYEPDVEIDIEVDSMGARVSLFAVRDYDLPELLTPEQARRRTPAQGSGRSRGEDAVNREAIRRGFERARRFDARVQACYDRNRMPYDVFCFYDMRTGETQTWREWIVGDEP